MRKIYSIKNIHCADCARSLEEVISGLDKVRYASINFLTEKFELEIDDSVFDEVFTKIKKIVRNFSQNVEIFELCDENSGRVGGMGEKIKFRLVGVACGNCANKIVDAINQLKEVDSSVFDMASGELRVTLSVKANGEVVSRIKSLIRTIDPTVKVKDIKDKIESNPDRKKFLLWAIGLMIAIPVILAEFEVFNLPSLAKYSLVAISALFLGYSTYLTAIRMLLRLNINENLLVSISVVGAILVGETVEGLMVVALYTLGKILEAKAVNKSRRSIKELMDISPEFAVVIRDGVEVKVLPKLISVGETIIVRPGEKIALDGVVVSGNCNINAQSLTGESSPILKKKGDSVMSGIVVLDGVLEIKVTKALEESTTTKILNLIEKASENKSKTETFISKFSKYYTLLVVISAVLCALITGIILNNWSTGIYRGLIFLVISCPCAFAISVPLSYFSGIGYASKRGILIKGSNYLDACAKAKVMAFDKTGTLTTGQFRLTHVDILEDAYSEEEIIEIAAIGEQNSIHPIAKTILSLVANKKLEKPESYREEAGVGISFEIDGTEYFVGKDDTDTSETKVVVKKGNILIGALFFEDEIKHSALQLSKELKNLGVKTALLSGDKEIVAKKVADTLQFDDVQAEMLPEDKYIWIEKAKENKLKEGSLIYVGDGINDAPSLALADVGVSMGIAGSGASIEASDVVIVDDDPRKTVDLIKISRFTKKIVIQNIIFASVIKLGCLVLGAVGVANMLVAVFADVGVTILAILNSLRALKGKNKKSNWGYDSSNN